MLSSLEKIFNGRGKRAMEIKDELKDRLLDYVCRITEPSPKAGRDFYNCPLCGSGKGRNGHYTGAFHVTGKVWKCHSCQKDGDVFNLYGFMHNLDPNSKEDFPKIVKGLSAELGVTDPEPGYTPPKVVNPEPKEDPCNLTVEQMNDQLIIKDLDRSLAINFMRENLPGSKGEAYLHERGLNDKTIEHFRLGYNENSKAKPSNTAKEAVVIPYPGQDYYTERLLEPGKDNKYNNLPGSAPTFAIHEDSMSPIWFITEGQIDAMSMWQVGMRNIIASHYPERLEKWLREAVKIPVNGALDYDIKQRSKTIGGVVIVSDQDEPGREQAEKLQKLFEKYKIHSVMITPPEGYKDSNDMLRKDPEKLRQFLMSGLNRCKKEIKQPEEVEEDLNFRDVTVSDYLTGNGFSEDIAYFRNYKDRKTGFANIDKYLTLYPGLACLTGTTSLGKTSFCVQLADQLLEKGETVLYFALEQMPIELVTKSLARRYYLLGGKNFSNIGIKNGATEYLLERVKGEYAEASKNFHIIQCDFTISADDIEQYVEKFIEKNNVKPIVIIDYLQLISPKKGYIGSDKEIADYNVKKFKLMSKKNELFVLMISNMARSSYKDRVGEDSFKESGLIEYTCDYLFGLQLAILEDDDFFSKKGFRGGSKDTQNYEKEDKIFEASQQNPKEVVFKASKNRNGKKAFKAFFKYRVDYDYFEVDNESLYDKEAKFDRETKSRLAGFRSEINGELMNFEMPK